MLPVTALDLGTPLYVHAHEPPQSLLTIIHSHLSNVLAELNQRISLRDDSFHDCLTEDDIAFGVKMKIEKKESIIRLML